MEENSGKANVLKKTEKLLRRRRRASILDQACDKLYRHGRDEVSYRVCKYGPTYI